MQLRTLFFLGLLAGGFWYSRGGNRQLPPPGIAVAGEPSYQVVTTPQNWPVGDADCQATALATCHIRGRVLGAKHYRDRAAGVAPYDLVLGWKRMSDPAVYAPLEITPVSRSYTYRLLPGAISRNEIEEQSIGYHLIPANEEIADTMAGVGLDDTVVMDGHLVAVRAPQGSSELAPLPGGSGGCAACRMFRVTRMAVEPRASR